MPKKKAKISPVDEIPIKNKLFGLFFILLAYLFLTSSGLPQKSNNSSQIEISSKLLNSNQKPGDIPIKVILPKQDIDLSVIPANVVDGYWETSDATASYGLGSGTPGTKSNTVIFAHAREGLFYNLKDVKKGDIVYVFTKNKWFKYKATKITAVYPDQIAVIAPTKTEELTLYTCTGYADSQRLIVSALPVAQ